MNDPQTYKEPQALQIVQADAFDNVPPQPAIDCGPENVDLQSSFNRMAALRGQGSVAEFERGVELLRIRALIVDGWGKYLSHPSVDMRERWVETLMKLAKTPGAKQHCETYGLTPALQLLRFKHHYEQRDEFIKEHPPNNLTVKELRRLIDRTLGHKRSMRKPALSVRVDHRVVWAAGALYLDENTLTPESVQEQYERLHHIFARGADRSTLRQTLDAAKTILDAALHTEPMSAGGAQAAA